MEGSINYGSVAVVRPNQDESREAAVATEGIEVWSVVCFVVRAEYVVNVRVKPVS